MRGPAVGLLVLTACGPPPPTAPLAGMDIVVSNVEWRVQASDAEHVEVALAVDGGVTKLGAVEATPELCAIRVAAAKVTELLCGSEELVAEVQPGELVVTQLIGQRPHVLARIAIGPSIAIIVAPYRIPDRTPPAPGP